MQPVGPGSTGKRPCSQKEPSFPPRSCKTCSGLLRPHVVWFGEALERKVLEDTDTALDECDLCLLVGLRPQGGAIDL